jgi:hypothetical protein
VSPTDPSLATTPADDTPVTANRSGNPRRRLATGGSHPAGKPNDVKPNDTDHLKGPPLSPTDPTTLSPDTIPAMQPAPDNPTRAKPIAPDTTGTPPTPRARNRKKRGKTEKPETRRRSTPGSGNAASPPADVTTQSTCDAGKAPPRGKADRANLLDLWTDHPGAEGKPLQTVRVDASEVVLIPFTAETITVKLHYCEEPEVRGYVHCNGADQGCVLCRAGRSAEERALLPLYVPASQAVGVLPISPNALPGALRPQILPVLRSGKRVAMLVRKPDRLTFKVDTVELKPGMDDGAATIASFLRRWEADEVDLASVYPRLENRDLAAVPGIAKLLTFKGIDADAVG